MNNATNNSVLGIAPLGKTLPIVGIVLVGLFVLMKPEASLGLSFLERLVFWSLQVGIGLAGIAVVSRLARPRWYGRLPLPATLLLVGLAGAALLAPAYVALEHFLPSAEGEMADSFLDRFAERGLVEAIMVEFLEVTPLFLAAWFAANLPLLLAKPDTCKNSPDDPPGPDGGRSNPAYHAGAGEGQNNSARAAFVARLPRAIGQNIVAISSDMHYLHVYTTLGRCMVLGALRDAAEALRDDGILVHRSHWVAHDHVKRLGRKDANWYCEMSNGIRIPVSRRNRNVVADWYGRADNVVTLSTQT